MGLLGGKKKVVIGLDVGSYAVKAVALQPNKGRLTLLGYSQARVGEDEVGEVVRRVIEQLGVRSRHLVTSVSGRSVIVRAVETPQLVDDELRSHMTYEADKYIPFSADEVVMDCHKMPPRLDGDASKMDVMLVAVRKGFVEDHAQMLQAAGAHPEVIDVDIFALANAWWTLGPQPPQGEGECVAIVDIGAAKSWVAIVKSDRMLFQREIYLAGNEITDAIVRTFNESPEDVEEIKLNPGDMNEALLDAAMPALEDLANEIRLSFDYVEGQYDQEVERIVLTGGSSLMPSLPDLLGNILGRPVTVFDPLAGVDLITSKYDLHSLEANAPALSIALGLACHLAASDDIYGLGGMQAASWTSRRGGGASGFVEARGATDLPEAPMPAAAPAPQRFAAAAPPLDMPAAPPPPPQPMAMPGPGPAYMPPPPPAPEVYEIGEGVSRPSEADIGSVTDVYSREASAMLVVLDDDDDEIDLVSNPSVTSIPEDDDDIGLPPLPR